MKLIIDLAARLHLPAVYPYRFFAETGGLVSYGDDGLELAQRAASHGSNSPWHKAFGYSG
jgi:putative ABC transport system substrate-binding protein